MPLAQRSEALEKAYNTRSSLCNLAWGDETDPDSDKKICGWTLAAFWVSAAHMGDCEGLVSELAKIPGDFMDKDKIEFYESSILHWMMYYTTIHGLFLQAVNDVLVSDFWGEDQIGYGLPKEWAGAKFYNLRTKNGGKYSSSKPCYVYILKCKDDSLYTGWTNDLEGRVAAHNAGTGAKYTRMRLPVALAYSETFDSKSEAMKREWEIKKLSRVKKMELILGFTH